MRVCMCVVICACVCLNDGGGRPGGGVGGVGEGVGVGGWGLGPATCVGWRHSSLSPVAGTDSLVCSIRSTSAVPDQRGHKRLCDLLHSPSTPPFLPSYTSFCQLTHHFAILHVTLFSSHVFTSYTSCCHPIHLFAILHITLFPVIFHLTHHFATLHTLLPPCTSLHISRCTFLG